jgi:hypothetical protein
MDNGTIISGSSNSTAYNRRGFSGSTLKLVAIITMLIDHIGAAVLSRIVFADGSHISESVPLYLVYNGMRTIGRLAFPIFCFLLVEGFLHTRNVIKYAIRLAVFALISEIPFDLALFGKTFYSGYQNVFFTLLIGLLVMIGFKLVAEKAADKKWLPVLAVLGVFVIGYTLNEASYNLMNNLSGFFNEVQGRTLNISGLMKVVNAAVFCLVILIIYLLLCWRCSLRKASIWFTDLGVLFAGIFLAFVLKTDYSGFGVLTIAVMYLLRGKHFRSMLGGCITLAIMSTSEIPAFLDLLLVLMYNGKRGWNMKYIFYAFYPVHLFILYLICRYMGLI